MVPNPVSDSDQHDLEILTQSISSHSLDALVTKLAESMGNALHNVSPIAAASSNPAHALASYLSMTMIPAYLYYLPTGREQGTFAAVDVGGSTLRIAIVRFAAATSDTTSTREILYQTADPLDTAIKNLDGRSFFLWMANQLQSVLFVAEMNGWTSEEVAVPVGLTWSFPLEYVNFLLILTDSYLTF